MNDIAPTLVGDSNQLSKADLMDGPQTFTVTRVDINLSDKKRPTAIHLVESPGKPFKPNLGCLLYTSPSPRDRTRSRMPSSA